MRGYMRNNSLYKQVSANAVRQSMKEGEIVTVDKLVEEWATILSRFDWFIEEGNKVRPIRFIVRHIIEMGYDKILFPGTSLFSLLISFPIDGKVNYTKTLRIEFDQRTEVLKFKFTNRTGIDKQNLSVKKQIKWEETCQATEGSALLESFLANNEDFKKATQEKLV